MAKKSTKSVAVATLLPDSIVVPINGEDIRVPTNKFEAATQNVLLVSQFRQVLMNALKTYKDKEMIPTPRELNDMASAIEKCNSACSNIFEKIENPMNQQTKEKEAEAPIDFTVVTDVITEKKPDGC